LNGFVDGRFAGFHAGVVVLFFPPTAVLARSDLDTLVSDDEPPSELVIGSALAKPAAPVLASAAPVGSFASPCVPDTVEPVEAPSVPDDEESLGAAHAAPVVMVLTAVPIPRATANAPTRPT
jgi:hypothetical protein